MNVSLELNVFAQHFALIQLAPNAPIPDWLSGAFTAVIRSADELSLVAEEACVPAGTRMQGGFRCLQIVGPFELDSVGIVAAVAQALAGAGIGLFAYSTWQTDYLLVNAADLDAAIRALRYAGHTVRNLSGAMAEA
jgi:hypothetical protein